MNAGGDLIGGYFRPRCKKKPKAQLRLGLNTMRICDQFTIAGGMPWLRQSRRVQPSPKQLSEPAL
jgi:hypothetical protein